MNIRKDTVDWPERLPPPYGRDRAFYDKLQAARPNYKLVEKFSIPQFSGKGFQAKKGQMFRFIQEEGPQVGDVSFWNFNNPKEQFSPERTVLLEGWVIRPGHRLWSDVPWYRPMATCLEDTVVTTAPEEGWHHHVVTSSHCTPELYEMMSGIAGLNACHFNLLEAIWPFGLREEDLRDNINIFMKTRLDPIEGGVHGGVSDAKKGDILEFYAEIDLLVAVSNCPNGTGSRHFSIPGKDTGLPIGVEVYDTGIPPKEFPKHTDWRPTWKGKWEPPESFKT